MDPTLLCWRLSCFTTNIAFEESMELPAVNVVITLAENPSLNIRTKWRQILTTNHLMGHEDLFQHCIRRHNSEDSWKHTIGTDRKAILIKEGDFWNFRYMIGFQKLSPTKGVRRLHCDLNWGQDLLDHISSLKGQIPWLVYQICLYNSNMCITYSVFLTLPLR